MYQSDSSGIWISAISLYMYLLFFSSGYQTYTSLLNSEMYPLQIRATSMSVATAIFWFLNLAISALFLSLISYSIADLITFIVIFFTSSITLYFSTTIIPETKCRLFSEVNEFLSKTSPMDSETLAEIRATRSKKFPIAPPDRSISLVNEF